MGLFSPNTKNTNNNENGKNNKVKKPLFSFSNNNTAQKTIPYLRAYDDGIIEVSEKVFTKSYFIADTNFNIASQDIQDDIFLKYGDLLNMFGNEIKAEITVYNRSIVQEDFNKSVLLPMEGDSLDEYRLEQNEIMLRNVKEGRNNIVKEAYLTVTVEADDYEKSVATFHRLDGEIAQAIKAINNSDCAPLTLKERLNLFYDIYHPDDVGYLSKTGEVDGYQVATFDINQLKSQGITTKDVIAPSSFVFNANNFQIGESYGQSIYLQSLPTYLSTQFIGELNDIPCNLLTSIHFDSLRQEKAMRLIKNQMVSIDSSIIERQQKAAKSHYSADILPPTLREAKAEAEKLLSDVTSRNQKLFYVSLVITHFAKDLETLETQKKNILAVGQKFLVNLKVLSSQQEWGLAASMPLGNNKLALSRLLTTEAASLFIPFSSQELFDTEGIYYGLNAVSRNLVLYDRTKSRNANGLILGTPGSGKSFAAKREMLSVLLGTDADVYVIDPEGEYTPLALMLGGEVVEISMGSKTYINPLDMDLDYANEKENDNQDPVTLKADFICSLCETIVGGKYGLSVTQHSIIDRCVRNIYAPYMKFMREHPDLGTSDLKRMPTLKHLYNELVAQNEPEAKVIALALERFVKGSLDTFANNTNVNIKSRFVVYNIVNIGKGLKELGLQVCLNDIWNRIISNRKKGKRTWFYIDEFYLLTQTESSAVFLQEIFKRARKWGGVPTGITQNVEDMLVSKEARTIISNSDFILMLNQSPNDRQDLATMLKISPTQLSYITNSPPGQGLLYTGETIIPFIDKYPTDTKSFAAMTSNMRDDSVQKALLENAQKQNKE